MNPNEWLIGTGFYHRPGFAAEARDFRQLWMKNLVQYVDPLPRIISVCSGGCTPFADHRVQNIFLDSNRGHIGDNLNGTIDSPLCGWSTVLLTLCMLAFHEGKHLLFRESDVLACGNWADQAIADLGDGQMCFGYKHDGPPWMSCEQSIVLIKHSYLLTFVADYLSLPKDTELLPESKFTTLEERDPSVFRRLSFGSGRVRPIPFHRPVFYGQQWTAEEMKDLRERGLL